MRNLNHCNLSAYITNAHALNADSAIMREGVNASIRLGVAYGLRVYLKCEGKFSVEGVKDAMRSINDQRICGYSSLTWGDIHDNYRVGQSAWGLIDAGVIIVDDASGDFICDFGKISTRADFRKFGMGDKFRLRVKSAQAAEAPAESAPAESKAPEAPAESESAPEALAESAPAESEMLRGEIKNLRADLSNMTAKRDALSRELEAAQAEIARLAKTNASLVLRLERATGELDKLATKANKGRAPRTLDKGIAPASPV